MQKPDPDCTWEPLPSQTLQACILCGRKDEHFKRVCTKGRYQLVQCETCGLVFVNPRDHPSAILSQYAKNETSVVSYYENTRSVDEKQFNRTLDKIEKRIRPGKMLDIGCNVGTFLNRAKKRGWEIAGMEANPRACEICRNNNILIHEGFFDASVAKTLSQEPFDCVVMNDSIEHFSNPLETLHLVRTLLKPSGLLCLTTPNMDSFLAKVFQVKPREHLFYFTKETLTKLLEQAMLKVEEISARGRRRDLGSLHCGATLENRNWIWVSKVLKSLKLDGVISLCLETFFSEEIFVVARKASK